MIEQVNRADYDVTDYRKEPTFIELAWYANDDNSRLGVVIETCSDGTFSWIMWAEGRHGEGYVTSDLGTGLESEALATCVLHGAMEEAKP